MGKAKKLTDEEKRQKQRDRVRKRRQDPAYRKKEQKKNTIAHRIVRGDSDKRRVEQQRNTIAHQRAREDPQRRSIEQQRNTIAHQRAREDPQRRSDEQQRNTIAHQRAREDPQRRSDEQQRNTVTHQRAREDPQRRSIEQQRNTIAHQLARENPQRRSIEQQRDTIAHQLTREDPVLRRSERIRNNRLRSDARQIPEERRRDSVVDLASKRRTTLQRASLHNQIAAFKLKEREYPEYICSCCGGLFFLSSTKIVTEESLEQHGLSWQEISQLLYVNQRVNRLCDTCYKTATKKQRVARPCSSNPNSRRHSNRIHKLCLANGLDFPDVPDFIKNLSPLEERLVSPFLPFMQIRLLRPEQQSKLKGNVINVENDLDVCATVLPRNMTETSTVQVQLLRKLQYRNPVWHEIIRPYNVRQAMDYLITSESYQERQIVLSDAWNNHHPASTVEFLADHDIPEENQRTSDNSESEDDDDDILARVNTTETLIMDLEADTMGYRIAPGEGKRPVPFLQDLEVEEITFPSIFGGQKRKLKEGVRLTNTDLFKSKIRNRNRICVKNATYLLYLFKKSFNQKVRDAIQVCMRKQRPGAKITAGNLRMPGFLEQMIQLDNGYVVFQGVRSTPAYWKKQQKKVVSMIRTLGKCSFFITFSAAETKWEPLLQALSKIVNNETITEEEARNLPYEKKCELIRSDPVTCMRYFDHRFRAFQNTLLRPSPPKQGVFSPHDVVDHFSRVEFQKRGSPHVHGLYWMRDAPVYNEDEPGSEEAVIQFIDKFVTCERDESDEMKELVGFQNHKHAATCRRWFGEHRKCRFRYPQPPLPETMILKPHGPETPKEDIKRMEETFRKITSDLETKTRDFSEDIPFTQYLESLALTEEDYINAIRSSINRVTVFLKRKTNAAFINAYNLTILKTWRANMDIQYVLDTYACAKYCVSYISKAEGGVSKLLQACIRDIRRGNLTMKEKLLRFASSLINGSEHSTQEAVAYLLGLHLTDCSRVDTYINTARPEERIGMLRPAKVLEELGDENDDIYVKGIIDRYVSRPNGLNNVCLADFASNYNLFKKRRAANQNETSSGEGNESENSRNEEPYDTADEDDSFELEDKSGEYRIRKVRKIIRFRHYRQASDEAEYWREQLMLFVPWRNEDLEILSVDHKAKADENMQLIIQNSCPFYFNRDVDETFIENNITNVEEQEDEAPNEDQPLIDEEADDYARQYVSENPSTSTMQRFLPPKFIPQEEYQRIMLALNVKQRKFVLHTLHLLKTTKNPFYAFLHGGAGVGKSHTITAIVQCFLRYHQGFPSANPECPPVIVTSFTGKAAFNILGMTLSSAFRLQPLQNKKAQGKLDDGAANTLRSKLRDLKLLIVDEISMVGVRMLYDVESRLRQIKCCDRPFGGISVIVVGHLRQLKPIGDSWVFKEPTHLRAGELGYIWGLFSFYEFDEIMRQKDDVPFCKLLNNMSEGMMDAEDIRLIRTREFDDCSNAPQNAILLFPTNEECQAYNKRIHETLQTEGFCSIAHDTVEGAKDNFALKERMLNFAKTLDVNQCDGLRFEVPLKVGAVYLISTNIDVSDGLFNGADGILMRIDYGRNVRVPNRVWLKFKDPIIGSNKRAVSRNYQQTNGIPLEWVPLERISKNLTKVKKEGASLIRVQFPLLAANAMTIAKSQGSTLAAVVVGLSANRMIRRESLYVACSRATSLNGLFIQGKFKPPTKPPPNDPVTLELQRLRELPVQLSVKFLQDFPNARIKLYFHNIQSYGQFGLHLFNDRCCLSADVISLVETRLGQDRILETEGFQPIFQREAKRVGNSLNSEGGLIFTKSGAEFIDCVVHYGSGFSHLTVTICRIQEEIVFTVYKHPEFPVVRFLDTFGNILDQYEAYGCVVVGDFNINAQSEDGRKLLQLMERFGLSSKLPMGDISTNFGTTIDYCFTNIPNSEAWFYESYYIHHKPICFMIRHN